MAPCVVVVVVGAAGDSAANGDVRVVVILVTWADILLHFQIEKSNKLEREMEKKIYSFIHNLCITCLSIFYNKKKKLISSFIKF